MGIEGASPSQLPMCTQVTDQKQQQIYPGALSLPKSQNSNDLTRGIGILGSAHKIILAGSNSFIFDPFTLSISEHVQGPLNSTTYLPKGSRNVDTIEGLGLGVQ